MIVGAWPECSSIVTVSPYELSSWRGFSLVKPNVCTGELAIEHLTSAIKLGTILDGDIALKVFVLLNLKKQQSLPTSPLAQPLSHEPWPS